MAVGTYPAVHVGMEEVVVNFRFQINGTSDPDNVVSSNKIVSDIARDAAGDFEITLESAYRYQNLIAAHVNVQGDADRQGQFISYTASTGVVVVETLDTDPDTNPPAADDPADDTWVHVTLVFCRRYDLATTFSV